MLLINLKALIERKAAVDGRRITYRTIEEATGIKKLTLTRIATNQGYNIKRKDLEKLLVYFDCEPNDLMTLIQANKKERTRK
jgi:DNA-binding Xre family transcriptional regulator